MVEKVDRYRACCVHVRCVGSCWSAVRLAHRVLCAVWLAVLATVRVWMDARRAAAPQRVRRLLEAWGLQQQPDQQQQHLGDGGGAGGAGGEVDPVPSIDVLIALPVRGRPWVGGRVGGRCVCVGGEGPQQGGAYCVRLDACWVPLCAVLALVSQLTACVYAGFMTQALLYEARCVRGSSIALRTYVTFGASGACDNQPRLPAFAC